MCVCVAMMNDKCVIYGIVPRSMYVMDVVYMKGYTVEDMLEYAADSFKDRFPRISWAYSLTLMQESVGIHFGFIYRLLNA